MQFSHFVWTLRYSVWDVFNNFLLLDATHRSKISSDQKRFFIALSLYPLSFFANTPFKVSIWYRFKLGIVIFAWKVTWNYAYSPFNNTIEYFKDVMQGKLFQKCTHILYCSVLSQGGNVNTRRISKPDMGSIFHIKKINEIFLS